MARADTNRALSIYLLSSIILYDKTLSIYSLYVGYTKIKPNNNYGRLQQKTFQAILKFFMIIITKIL